MQKKKRHVTILVCALAVLVFTAQAQAITCDIATGNIGWNADVIFEASLGSAGTKFDNPPTDWGWAFAQDQLVTVAGTVNPGLPASGSFTAPGSGVTYQLEPYSRANALRMTGSGTFNLDVTDGQYAALYIVASSGDGGGTSDIVLNFATGASTRVTNALYAPDWYVNSAGGPYTSNVAIGGLDRVTTAPNLDTTAVLRGKFQLYETVLNLDAGDQSRTLKSIDFATAVGAGATSVFDVQATCPVPLPGAALLLGAGLVRLIAYRRQK